MGRRQTFVRFAGCNLVCAYCDTAQGRVRTSTCVLHGVPTQNPVSLQRIVEAAEADEIALTGGEPLLQAAAVEQLCPMLRAAGKRVYLDTNATLPGPLERIVDQVDFFALDFKVPSATGEPAHWAEHEACLGLVANREVFVKLVIDRNVTGEELKTACTIIKRVSPGTPLVLQPVHGAPLPDLLALQAEALRHIPDVRVIPQVHKILQLP